jgi:hypothetical protein
MRRREFLKKAGVGPAASFILGPSLVRAQAGPVIRVAGLTAGAVKGLATAAIFLVIHCTSRVDSDSTAGVSLERL